METETPLMFRRSMRIKAISTRGQPDATPFFTPRSPPRTGKVATSRRSLEAPRSRTSLPGETLSPISTSPPSSLPLSTRNKNINPKVTRRTSLQTTKKRLRIDSPDIAEESPQSAKSTSSSKPTLFPLPEESKMAILEKRMEQMEKEMQQIRLSGELAAKAEKQEFSNALTRLEAKVNADKQEIASAITRLEAKVDQAQTVSDALETLKQLQLKWSQQIGQLQHQINHISTQSTQAQKDATHALTQAIQMQIISTELQSKMSSVGSRSPPSLLPRTPAGSVRERKEEKALLEDMSDKLKDLEWVRGEITALKQKLETFPYNKREPQTPSSAEKQTNQSIMSPTRHTCSSSAKIRSPKLQRTPSHPKIKTPPRESPHTAQSPPSAEKLKAPPTPEHLEAPMPDIIVPSPPRSNITVRRSYMPKGEETHHTDGSAKKLQKDSPNTQLRSLADLEGADYIQRQRLRESGVYVTPFVVKEDDTKKHSVSWNISLEDETQRKRRTSLMHGKIAERLSVRRSLGERRNSLTRTTTPRLSLSNSPKPGAGRVSPGASILTGVSKSVRPIQTTTKTR